MITLEQLRTSAAAVVTIKDAADLMGVNRRTLTGALSVNGGEIPARRIGRRIVIPREAFLHWYSGEEKPAEQVTDDARESPDRTHLIRARLLELLSDLESA